LGRDILQNGTDAERIIRLALQNGAMAYKVTESTNTEEIKTMVGTIHPFLQVGSG